MSIQERAFSLAAKVIRVISLKNVALWGMAALVGVTGYTFFENRSAIVNYIVNGPEADTPQVANFTISETSKTRIKQATDGNALINGIIILNADIRNNRRIPLFWYSDDNFLSKALDNLFNGRYGGIPLFTADEKNNENIVGIINGEFACGAYTDSGNGTIFPGLSANIPYTCRTSLPPYYGQFSGYLTITLNRVPSPDELATLKAEALNISTEVYFRDVLPSNRRITK